MTEVDKNPDVLVIGAGPGGYTAAIRLGQYGLNPVVVEEENVGGVCLNWGCIPTKTLYSSSQPLSRMEAWKNKGVEISDYDLQLDKMADHKEKVVKKLTDGVEKLIESSGGNVLQGKATVKSRSRVIVKSEDGEKTSLEPENIIIATGSAPIELPGFPFDSDLVWSSRDAVRLSEIPDELVILGGGVIGLEMATIYNRLGAEIEILEMADSILPGMNLDRRFSSLMSRQLNLDGIEIHTETRAVELKEKSGGLVVVGEKDGESREFTADRVLSAVGRSPNTGSAAEELNLKVEDRGFIEIDERCRTSEDGIYAIGDVAGQPLLAHKAAKEGLIAAADIVGEDVSQYKVVPAAVFTDPEYAEVGLSQDAAREAGYDIRTGRFPFRASGKALAMDEPEGAVQLIADRSSDKLLGGAILGPHASDLIGEITLAIEMELTAGELAETIHTHPTLSEAIMEAAENVHDRAIHTGNR